MYAWPLRMWVREWSASGHMVPGRHPMNRNWIGHEFLTAGETAAARVRSAEGPLQWGCWENSQSGLTDSIKRNAIVGHFFGGGVKGVVRRSVCDQNGHLERKRRRSRVYSGVPCDTSWICSMTMLKTQSTSVSVSVSVFFFNGFYLINTS